MAKILTIRISKCMECVYRAKGFLSEPPYCTAPGAPKEPGSMLKHGAKSIPKWCPLPDAPKEDEVKQ